MPSLTLEIAPNTKLHRKLVKELCDRIRIAEREQQGQHESWEKAENEILAYLPETDDDALRRADRTNKGNPRYTTMKIPYSYALLMAAHTYWTSVFFARTPVHQFSGVHGEGQNKVQAMEALIAYQVNTGKMLAPYYLWLYDAGKYGVGIVQEFWDTEEIYYSTIQLPNPEEGGKQERKLITQKTMGYQGNRVQNVSPWDWLPDPRVTVGNFQRGEFCIAKRRPSWAEVKQREKAGYYMNVDEWLRTQHEGQKQPEDEDSQLNRPLRGLVFGEQGNKTPAILEVYECYVHLIPEDWGLPGGSNPQKWVFTLTEDKSILLGAQPLGAIHGRFPFSVLEPEVEAYGSWNRGIPAIMEPIQNTMDWLLNSHMYNVRAVLNNLFVADPTKVVMKDLENPLPGGLIRTKPAAYGQDVRSFLQQLQTQDVTQSHVADMQTMLGIGERVSGINDQILGVLAAGGRKTATEVRTSTGFGVNRLKTMSEYMSVTGFNDHARTLVMNSQQFYDAEMKLRIVGDLSQAAGPQFIDVNPEMIAGAYDLVPVDGTLPIDRLAQANLWKELMMGIQRFPQIMQQYDFGRIFAWVASLAGLKNLDQFKIEVVPDAQLAMQAQAGNVVPIENPDSRTTGLPNPSQTRGASI